MADFPYTAEATINLSADKTFGVVSNSTQHVALAGSDEMKKIILSPGPVGVGTNISLMKRSLSVVIRWQLRLNLRLSPLLLPRNSPSLLPPPDFPD